jgi:hypothetical protein
MHFGYYLMMAALILMGLEVLYALYQLATFLWENFSALIESEPVLDCCFDAFSWREPVLVRGHAPLEDATHRTRRLQRQPPRASGFAAITPL